MQQIGEGLRVKVGLDDNYEKTQLRVIITHKNHPMKCEIGYWFRKKAEEKPPV